MSFLMMAAHDTLASSVSSLVYLLGKHPEWHTLRAEMQGLGLPRGSLRKTERAGTLRDGLQGIDAHQPAGAWDTTHRRARLPIQRIRHSGWNIAEREGKVESVGTRRIERPIWSFSEIRLDRLRYWHGGLVLKKGVRIFGADRLD
jgi:cytochrome P450